MGLSSVGFTPFLSGELLGILKFSRFYVSICGALSAVTAQSGLEKGPPKSGHTCLYSTKAFTGYFISKSVKSAVYYIVVHGLHRQI